MSEDLNEKGEDVEAHHTRKVKAGTEEPRDEVEAHGKQHKLANEDPYASDDDVEAHGRSQKL